jgi:heat shock protein HtpX
MEMCVDNPRSGFADLFASHPPIDARVAALVTHAGGRDPGVLKLPEPEAAPEAEASGTQEQSAPEARSAEASSAGPWEPTSDRPPGPWNAGRG